MEELNHRIKIFHRFLFPMKVVNNSLTDGLVGTLGIVMVFDNTYEIMCFGSPTGYTTNMYVYLKNLSKGKYYTIQLI